MGSDGLDIDERDLDGNWLTEAHEGPLEATDDLIDAARSFAFERWQEMAAERGTPAPADMSGACKFNALFVKLTFGGEIQGNYDHVHAVVEGRVIDLQADAADVKALADPYRNDEDFIWDDDFAYSIGTCLVRCQEWSRRFVAEQAPAPAP
jgi:hypothetical protein